MADGPIRNEAWKEEERQQAQALAMAINAAIMEYGQMLREHGKPPMLNAIAGALVTVEATMLSSVKDARARKALRKAMDRERPKALAEAMQRDHGSAQVVTVGGRLQ